MEKREKINHSNIHTERKRQSFEGEPKHERTNEQVKTEHVYIKTRKCVTRSRVTVKKFRSSLFIHLCLSFWPACVLCCVCECLCVSSLALFNSFILFLCVLILYCSVCFEPTINDHCSSQINGKQRETNLEKP